MNWNSRELVAAFRRAESRSVEAPPQAHTLLVEALEPSRSFFAAVDSIGSWVFVVRARATARAIPALRLSLLSADYGATYELREREDAQSLRVCIIRCIAPESEVRNLFATVCVALLDHLPVDPSDADVETAVSHWVTLFWRLQLPARTSVIGLIGELSLLDSVERLPEWVRGWHLDPQDNLDFAFTDPQLSVEVKATSSQQRIHEISASQAVPLVPNSHFFASVIVEVRDSGVRIGDVVGELSDRLAGRPEADLFWRSIASTCGASIDEYFNVRYMRQTARNSLRLYPAEAVPRPLVEFPLPAGVEGLRFRSDFSSTTPIESRAILDLAAGSPSHDAAN